MDNKEVKKQSIEQIKKTEYGKQMESLNKEVVSILGEQAELNAAAFDLASRVSEAFKIAKTDIFKVFLNNFDFGTAKYCYLTKQSENFSWMFSERVSAIFSKIRLVGYLLSKNKNFNVNLTQKITVSGITLRVIDLPFQSFKAHILGDDKTRNPDDVLSRMVNTFKSMIDKYLDSASQDTITILSDTVSGVLNSVNKKLKEIQESKAKAEAEAYKEFLKEFNLKDSKKSKGLFKKYRK